jgi:anti-anti-sigma regulatory factor
MSLTVNAKRGKTLLKFDGPFTIYEVSDYLEKLIKIFSEKKSVVMDLTEVDDCDAAGIQLICSALIPDNHGKKICISGISHIVQDTAETLGIDTVNIFNIKEAQDA